MDAAEALIRESRSTDFSMLTLAERAGLSPATPYNLLGSKAGVLYGLLNRVMDKVVEDACDAGRAEDPYLYVLQLAGAVAQRLAEDPGFYRPLYRFLLGVSDPVNRPAYMDRGLEFWKFAVQGLHEGGQLPPEIDRDELARELEIHFVGVLDLWVQEELDGSAFQAQTVYGASLMLMSVADEAARVRLITRIRALKKKLPKRFSYRAAFDRLHPPADPE